MKPKRVVLFDIDGTLLHTKRAYGEAFLNALRRFYPKVEKISHIRLGGKTDPQIVREYVQALGGPPPGYSFEKLMKTILEDYVAPLRELKAQAEPHVETLPGARTLVESLSNHEHAELGILSGNIEESGQIKLEGAGLRSFFKFGVWGSDHEDRYELPRIALKKFLETFGVQVSGENLVIIGDTIHDVGCGRSLGVKTIAVGTGRGIDQEELKRSGPHHYFEDLSETERLIDAILS